MSEQAMRATVLLALGMSRSPTYEALPTPPTATRASHASHCFAREPLCRFRRNRHIRPLSGFSFRLLSTVAAVVVAAATPGTAADAWDPSKPMPVTGDNLLPNGAFEKGKTTPDGWQTIDGLTTFWVEDEDPERGKVIKFDTDLLQSQAYEWWAKIVEGASPKDAPAKVPSSDPNKYDTLAAFDGAWFFSDFIPVEPGRSYWLALDAKGAEMMCWLLGYKEKYPTSFGDDEPAFLGYLRKRAGYDSEKRGFEKIPFKRIWKGQLKAGGSNEWKTYCRREKPLSPTKNTPSVRYVRVLILPYWPAGQYYIDNVRLFEYRKPEATIAGLR